MISPLRSPRPPGEPDGDSAPRRRWEPTVVDGALYRTRKSLEGAIKAELARIPRDRPAQSPFLAAVVNEFHDDVRAAGQRCNGQFLILTPQGQRAIGLDTLARYGIGQANEAGILVTAYFAPFGDWRPVSVYPWRKSTNPRQHLKRALREKIRPKLPRPTRWDSCAAGLPEECYGPLEYQHIAPTFDEIAEQCLALMTVGEIESLFGYSKFVAGKDELCHCIPDDHPAIVRLLALHRTNRWEWLCSFHHRGDRTRR